MTPYAHDYLLRYKQASKALPDTCDDNTQHIAPRVIELASSIKEWHDARPIPERWQAIQLGRLAARFGASREIAAAALHYAGWIEVKHGNCSLWAAPIK